MKTIKITGIIILVAFVSFVQAQKQVKLTDVVEGKTMFQHAQKIDLDAFLQTKAIYKTGMTEADFVAELQKNFPPEAASFKHVCVPYFKYIYSFHKKGLTENQVKAQITGTEFVSLCNDLGTWSGNNPEVILQAKKITWKGFLEFLVQVIPIILEIFF